MKRSLIIMLVATLLAGALMVSCNSDITSNSEDKLVKVSIAGNSKGIDVQSVSDSADDYYWYYKAVKTDNSVYRTGSTEWKAVKNGTGLTGADLGYFSTGDWKFSFWGYSTPVAEAPTAAPADGYAYYKTDLAVSVTDTTYITVELNAVGTGTAKVVIGDMNWVYQPETNTTYQATLDYLNGKEATIHFDYKTGTNEYASLTTKTAIITSSSASAVASFTNFASNLTLAATAEGTVYKIKAYVTIGDETVGESSEYTVTAYYGGKVVLTMTGDVAVTDNESGYHVFIAGSYIPEIGAAAASSKTAIENVVVDNQTVSAAKQFTTNITAVSQSVETTTESAQTSVAFEADSFTLSTDSNTSSEIKMDIVVYQTEAAQAKFTVSQNTTAFAGLDLSVDLITTTTTGTETTTETESVEEFRGQAVTVTTYIARGLSGVTVTCPTNNTGITFNTGDSIGDDGTGYDPATGKLVFKTTHFSEFAVGADQNVYDKTSNTGYRIGTSDDGTDKEGLLLNGANAVVAVNKDHEYLLLDKTKANDVDDSIDAFNSYINWSVVHPASDTPKKTGFAGGYGTKIEPYLVYDSSTMKLITENSNEGCYYKVDVERCELINNSRVIDCQNNWTPIILHGNFDGSDVTFINLNNPLFKNVFAIGTTFDLPTYSAVTVLKNFKIDDCNIVNDKSYYVGAVVVFACDSIEFNNIEVSGYLRANGVGSFLGQSNGYDWYHNNGNSGDYPVRISFIDCHSSMNLVSGAQTGGFIGNVCWSNNNQSYLNSSVNIIDSYFDGTMSYGSSYKAAYVHAHSIYNTTYVNFVYSQGKNDYSYLYHNDATGSNTNYLYAWVYDGTTDPVQIVQINKPATGEFFTGTALNMASIVKVYLCIGTDPGMCTYNYIVETIDVSNNKEFSTTKIMNYSNISLENGGSFGQYQIDGTSLTVDSGSNIVFAGASVRIDQFNSDGKLIAVSNVTL